MTMLNGVSSSHNFSQNWVEETNQQIRSHNAWHGDIPVGQAEAILSKEAPYAFILRTGGGEGMYYISFVKPDYSIYHQSFRVDYRGLYYRNCVTTGRNSELHELIPLMMYCDPSECRPLGR